MRSGRQEVVGGRPAGDRGEREVGEKGKTRSGGGVEKK